MDQQQARGRPGKPRRGLAAALPRQRLFREVNEEIARLSASFGGSEEETLSVLCECATGCSELITLSAREFEELRREPGRFIVKSGHENGVRPASIVGRGDGYVVVEQLERGSRPANGSEG